MLEAPRDAPAAASGTYYESCVIPYDVFYSEFDSLADAPEKALLEELRGYVRDEQFVISPARFELLLSLIRPPHPRGTRRAAFKLIAQFADFPPDKFLEMIPATFVGAVYAALPSASAFELLTRLATIAPDVIPQYLELGIVPVLAPKLDFHAPGFESALEMLACLMRAPLARAELWALLELVLGHTEKCNRTEGRCVYVSFLRKVCSFDSEVRDRVLGSQAFFALFQAEKIRESLRIQVLKLVAVVVEYPEPPAPVILGQGAILRFVLDSVAGENERIVTAACFSLFRMAAFDDGRELLIAHGIPSHFVSLLNGASSVLTNHLIWVLAQIAMSDRIEVVETILHAGFIEAIAPSLEGLDQKAMQISLDALLNVERLGYLLGRDELPNAIYSNADLVGALANLTESSDQSIWESANSLYAACIRSDKS